MSGRPGEKGFTLGELIIVFLIVTGLGILLLPLVARVNERSDRVMCANNVKELGRALYIYASEHEERFPESMKVLYDQQYISDRRLMDCPASAHAGTIDDPDYIYTAGLTVKSPSMETLLRDKSDNHPRGGVNILHVNGAVEWEQ